MHCVALEANIRTPRRKQGSHIKRYLRVQSNIDYQSPCPSVMSIWSDSERLEHREVVARFGLELEGHIFVVFGHNLAPEAPGFPGDALPPLLVGQPPLVLLLAVPPQTHLPNNALEQFLHIVLHSCRGLNELAVKHHSTRSSF